MKTKDDKSVSTKMGLLSILILFLLSFSPAEAFDFHCGKNHVKEDINHLVAIRESHENFQFNKKGEIIGLQIQVYLFFEDEYGWRDYTIYCEDVESYSRFTQKLRKAYEKKPIR